MRLRNLAVAGMALAIGLGGPPAAAMPIQSITCTPSEDGSSILILATTDGSEHLTCTFSCHVKLTGQSAFQGYKCRASVGAAATDQLLCELKGDGPGHFSDARPDRFDC